MSATTRHSGFRGLGSRRLNDLVLNAVYLVANDKRSKRQVEMLLKALQLFKEDRLGAVWAGDSREMQARRRRNRLALREKLDREHPNWRADGRDPADFAVPMFDLSPIVGASEFCGTLPPFRQLLCMSERAFLDTPSAQALLREIKEKIEPHGLYFGMTEEEINEVFGPPPPTKS